MGLFDVLRDKKEQKAIKENNQKKETAAKNRETANDTVEKIDNVLNNIGYLDPDKQNHIRKVVNVAKNDLRYSQTIASCDLSEGDRMLGVLADQLANALKKKDNSASTSALKIIQKALYIRKDIKPYSESSLEEMVEYYERVLRCGQLIMSAHDKLYDTNVTLAGLNRDKANLEKQLDEAEKRVQTLVDENPAAARFVQRFNPNGTQKLSDCKGAQELADAYAEFKSTKKRLTGTVTKIGKYNDTAHKNQINIDEQMQVIDTKNTAMTAEQIADMNALLKESQDVLIKMDASNKAATEVIDEYYDVLEAIGNDPDTKIRVMNDYEYYQEDQKRRKRQEEEGRRFEQELERQRMREQANEQANDLENEQALESENTQRQTITN